MKTKILLMAVVVAVVGICLVADVYAAPVKALVINKAIDDIAYRLRVQESQMRLISIKTDRVNPSLFTVVLQGPNPLTSKIPDTFTYTIKVNKHPNSTTPQVQIIGLKYSDGSYDTYYYSGTLVSRIEQFDALGNSKATILYYGNGNKALKGRINTITHWKAENGVKTAKYTDVYKYVNNYNLRSFEVFRYKGDVWVPEAKPLCVFLYVGRTGLEKLTKCTFADGSYITYANELAQAVFTAGSNTPEITFRYLDANGQPTTKNIATTVVSYFGGKFKIAHEGIIDPVDVVVEYRSRELIGHKIIVDGYEAGEFIGAKEIWTFLTPDAPYVDEEWILAYDDEAMTNVIDAQIVRTFDTGDEYADHQQVLYYTSDGVFAGARDFTHYYVDTPAGKRIDHSIVKYYGDKEMTELYEVQEISWDVYPGELIDCKVVVNSDENGAFLSAQKILTFMTLYDSHSKEQWIWTYSDEAMKNVADAQIVRTFDTGDEYTDHQQILRYMPDGLFVDAQDITNYYIDSPSCRLLYCSIIDRYADENMTPQSWVERQVITWIGGLLDIKEVISIDENGVFLSAQKILTFDTSWQPYHTEQWIFTYSDEAMTKANMLDAKIVRTFDTGDEYVEHTQVLTYTPDGTFAQAQDITNYYMDSPSGRFLYCSNIKTYADEDMNPQSFVDRQETIWIGDLLDIQEVISTDENGVFLSAQKILTFDTSWQPYHTEQWIWSYDDEAMTNCLEAQIVRIFDTGDEYTDHQQVLRYTPDGTFLDAQDITDNYIDSPWGRLLYSSTIYTYVDENMTPQSLIERKVITWMYNLLDIQERRNYDENGVFMSAQKILTFDTPWQPYHTEQWIWTYLDEAMTDCVDAQIVRYFYTGDEYVEHTQVLTYMPDGTFAQAQDITNYYMESPSGRRLEHSTVYTYADEAMTELLDTKVIENLAYDARGNIVLQQITVYAGEIAPERFVERILIENLVYDSRGNVVLQQVNNYYDDSGSVMRMQLIENLAIDEHGNALEMEVWTYYADANGDLILAYRQHIISCDYDVNSRFVSETTITYAEDGFTILDIKVRDNIVYDANGRVVSEQVTIYTGDGNFIEMQIIENLSFDEYGRVIEQQIERIYYDPDGAQIIGSETQVILISAYNIHNHAIDIVVEYYEGTGSDRLFCDTQVIHYLAFDLYGNVERQTIDTYDDIGMPASSLVSHKDITNDYGWEGQTILVQLNDGSIITESSDFARRNGIALQTVIAETDNNGMLIQKTVVTNSLFDVNGNAIDQTIDKFVADSSGQEKLATRTLIHNVDFDSNGNVVTQEITTYATDAAGANLEVTSYQVLTNRQFDSEHNVISQIVYTYEFAGGQLLDIQEIRSTGYNSSGVAREQDIVTYADESRTQVIEARHIQNSNIDSSGNVRLSDIYIYSGAVITGGSSGGAITFTGFLERQTISTTLFDARGNALEMQIEKAYYDPDGVLLGIDTQVITNSPYSIYNRPISSTIVNYVGMGSDKIFTDVQVIQYLSYDRYGNARHQTVDTYDDVNIVSSSLVSHKVITNTYEAVSVHDADTVTYTSPQLTSDVTSGVIDEVLSKQDAIQASRSQLSGGKFQRKSLFEDESPVQLRWNR